MSRGPSNTGGAAAADVAGACSTPMRGAMTLMPKIATIPTATAMRMKVEDIPVF